MKKTILIPVIAFVFTMSTGCTNKYKYGFEIDWKGLKESQKKFDEKVRQTAPMFMSLETMFPDEKVRMLAKAAGKGRTKQVETLVGSGIDVNARGTSDVPLLYWALRKDSYKGFKKLLEMGADPNLGFDGKYSVMHAAALKRDIRFLRAVLEHGGNPNLMLKSKGKGKIMETTPIFDAMSRGKSHIDLLLDAGADLNAQDNFGFTPAMSAAGMSDFEIVYYLLEKGADYRIKSNAGGTLASSVADTIGALRPGSKYEKWQARVIDWLESRGVQVR